MDLSVDTMHLKDPLILFGSEGPALTFSPFLPRVINALSLFLNNGKGSLFFVKHYGTKGPLGTYCI